MSDVRNVIVIGGGPAGYTAALYSARANLNPLVIEGFNWGGQLMITSDVENYPGYADGVMGPVMMQDFRRQAERFGAEFLTDDVTRVDFSERPFRVWVGNDEYRAETIVVATGASARQLGLESELRLQGRGVSYCATCDASFFRDKVVTVVGGGDSALEEATFISRFASKVYLVHRREEFRASPIMVDRGRAAENIEFVLNKVVEEVLGDAKVSGVRLRDTVTDEVSELETDGFFVAIGHDPNTALFLDQLDHEADTGYLVTQGQDDRDEHPGRLRSRRRAGSRLSAGRHRGRLRVCGGARRRAVSQRPSAQGADRADLARGRRARFVQCLRPVQPALVCAAAAAGAACSLETRDRGRRRHPYGLRRQHTHRFAFARLARRAARGRTRVAGARSRRARPPVALDRRGSVARAGGRVVARRPLAAVARRPGADGRCPVGEARVGVRRQRACAPLPAAVAVALAAGLLVVLGTMLMGRVAGPRRRARVRVQRGRRRRVARRRGPYAAGAARSRARDAALRLGARAWRPRSVGALRLAAAALPLTHPLAASVLAAHGAALIALRERRPELRAAGIALVVGSGRGRGRCSGGWRSTGTATRTAQAR